MSFEVPLPGPPRDPVAGIDDALAGLDGLAQLDVAEHVARFDEAHTALTAALTTIDKV
ncbi:hypothetical protein [Saccharothrix australiensis]|uniref:Uncharacterized protein n=1 Tax=Saccharothrix australiensis TaxID=2072 RepID=A0A495W7J9_9PSEU|nr:hypothetical protein [Saccharothrix australiensis]RKT56613.1 hypothetical protein C8E97_5317 [Saccharothrix australiensis]